MIDLLCFVLITAAAAGLFAVFFGVASFLPMWGALVAGGMLGGLLGLH